MGRSRTHYQEASNMIALVDCNNFFASCERLFRPDLKNKPVLVLSNNDGCIVARSDEVKELGIPMAVPYFKVRDIVSRNNVQCFSSNFPLYSNMSQRILTMLTQYAPEIEAYSIDEAFMQLANLEIDNYQAWGDELIERVKHDIGIPISVGIAPTKTLAKLASGMAKKQRKTCIIDPPSNPNEHKSALEQTKVSDIWGIGWRSLPKFSAYGIRNAWQLSQVSTTWIRGLMGVNGARLLQELQGTNAFPFEGSARPQKSLMVSRSFGHTVTNIHDLETAVATFASQAAFKLRQNKQATKSIGLYVRYKDREEVTNSRSLRKNLLFATNDTSELVSASIGLMEEVYDQDNGYKKAGVFASPLFEEAISQVDLFDERSPREKNRRASFLRTVDAINNRYGSETIHVGTLDDHSTSWHAQKKRMSPPYLTDWANLPLVHR